MQDAIAKANNRFNTTINPLPTALDRADTGCAATMAGDLKTRGQEE